MTADNFDPVKFNETLDDIERFLGYMKGNEQVRQYVHDVRAAAPGVPQSLANPAYLSPTIEEEYSCDFLAYRLFPVRGSQSEAERQKVGRELYKGFDEAWNNGVRWSYGIAGYLRSIVETFTMVSVSDYEKTVVDLKNVPLWSLLPADFAGDGEEPFAAGLQRWYGQSASAFQTFYGQLAGRGAMYAQAVQTLASWVDAVGAITAVTQQGLLKTVESVRDDLKRQLQDWHDTHGNPLGHPKIDMTVVHILGLSYNIIGDIPVVGELANLPKDVKNVVDAIAKAKKVADLIAKYTKMASGHENSKPVYFSTETADQIYTSLTTVFYDDHLKPFNQALDKLRTDQSGPFLGQVESLIDQKSWFPHPVPSSVRTDTWSYDAPDPDGS